MAQILVRNLSPETVERLKARARRNNRSLEAEVRDIVEDAASDSATPEFRVYLDDVLRGMNKNEAFRKYLEGVQSRQSLRPRDFIDSTEDLHEARAELDARLS